ncbi:proline--tRNA ligase [Candidatus Palauibacter sp.]|uniref:proline--tRNA ligase n=1 Tax=Candidatus Palauibacter sp. TaxID=3101350 RepID=UPI003C6FCB04
MTLRQAPGEAEIESHRLLLRAGYVRQLAAGIFSYLPLAWRCLRKIEQILREEMDRIDGQELSMPVVHPAELWQATGRWYDIDATMARFVDRRERDMLLAMTHEEVVAFHTASEIQSYRQLPAMVYHMQTKFRDELRSRGGLIRVREFTMKDSYSLDRDREGLEAQYDRHYEAYERIGHRCGLPLTAVKSDTGMMGGKIAHEFMYVTPIGEDSLALCDACGYAANREVAEFTLEPADGEMSRLERVHTPETATIADLTALLGISARATAKMVFYVGSFGGEAGVREEKLIAAIVRGDLEANSTQVQNLTGALELRPAREEEIAETGMVPGFASPVGIDPGAAIFVVDRWVAASPNLVMGANEADHHLHNVCCGRDYEPTLVGPVAAAFEGAPCGGCGEGLRMARGVEVGNIFQLGTRYSEALEATFTDEEGVERPIWMGSYGIGLGRLLACVAEEYHDEYGLRLPISVAPYHVSLVGLAREEETWSVADRVFDELCAAGIEVLYDDRRDLRAGVKFNDADLRGFPLRLVIGERSVAAGGAELGHRGVRESRIVPLEDLVAELRSEIDALQARLTLDG